MTESDIVVRIEAERASFKKSTVLFRISHRGRDFSTYSLTEFHKALEKAINQRITEVI